MFKKSNLGFFSALRLLILVMISLGYSTRAYADYLDMSVGAPQVSPPYAPSLWVSVNSRFDGGKIKIKWKKNSGGSWRKVTLNASDVGAQVSDTKWNWQIGPLKCDTKYKVKAKWVGRGYRKKFARTAKCANTSTSNSDPKNPVPTPTKNFGGSMWFKYSDYRSAPLVGDFDNDRYEDDIVYYGKCGSGVDCWRAHIGNKTSFSLKAFGANMWFAASDARARPVVGDFDNDGWVDDIAYFGKCGSGGFCWRAHLSNGNAFTSVKNLGGNDWFKSPINETHAPVSGDFDNDGYRDDIAYYGRCGSGVNCWRVHLLKPSLKFQTTSLGGSMWFKHANARSAPVAGDFVNDGRDNDIVYSGKCGSGGDCWRVHKNNGSLNSPSFSVSGFGARMWFATSDARARPVVGDFDRDGKNDDIVYFGKCGPGYNCWRAHLSNGSSFNVTDNLGGRMWFKGSRVIHAPVSGDFDEDGHKDDIAYYGKCGSGVDCWRVHLLE